MKRLKKMILLKNKNIYIGKSDIEGYGVFTNSPISNGDILQECPFIPLSYDGQYGPIKDYTFDLDHLGFKNSSALPFGTGWVYNSSLNIGENNADWEVEPENKIIKYFATRDIDAGEEILVYYGDSWMLERFKKREISKKI